MTAARDRLRQAGLDADEATADARVLAQRALGWDHATLLARAREPSPARFPAAYEALLARRTRREPVAQIVGRREFWGLDFLVTRDVLTPRPESELLVEEALAWLRSTTRPHPMVADVGTGSGCLVTAIAVEAPSAWGVAIDIAEPALAVARRNAERIGVADRIVWRRGSLLDGLDDEVDLVVANLPYVPAGDIPALAPEVREYEPVTALDGGPDGLDLVRAVMRQAPVAVRSGGRLLLEVGVGQADAVTDLARATATLTPVGVRQDLQGIPRVVIVERTEDADTP